MSFVDGQVADFRGGRKGLAGTQVQISNGHLATSAVYTLTAGAYVGPVSVPPILVYDNIGKLSGNTWIPNDVNARYLITVDLQNTGGGALQAAIQTAGGTIFVSGQAATTNHLTLHTDVVDFSVSGNIDVAVINSATIGAPSGLTNANCNQLCITKVLVQ